MASPIKKGFNQVMNGFKEIDQPIYTGARAKTSQATPVEEPIMARSQSSLFQLIPQLSQSVFGSMRPDQKLFGQAAQEDNTINANPSAPIEEQPRSQDHDEFSELVNWAKGSISSSSTTSTTTSQVVLTDDGRTMTEEEAKPTCPICSETFQIGQIKALELHVDSHLLGDFSDWPDQSSR